MGAVLAGMTVLQLAQFAAAVGAAGVSFWTIHEDLKTAGLSDHDPIPQQMMHAVATALRDLADKLEPP